MTIMATSKNIEKNTKVVVNDSLVALKESMSELTTSEKSGLGTISGPLAKNIMDRCDSLLAEYQKEDLSKASNLSDTRALALIGLRAAEKYDPSRSEAYGKVLIKTADYAVNNYDSSKLPAHELMMAVKDGFRMAEKYGTPAEVKRFATTLVGMYTAYITYYRNEKIYENNVIEVSKEALRLASRYGMKESENKLKKIIGITK